MERKSTRAVLRSVVVPAIGASIAMLSASACERTPSTQSTVEQPPRDIRPPGMMALPEVTPRDIPPPGMVPVPESTPDAAAPVADVPVEHDIVRPPPGPPARHPGDYGLTRPRPGPPAPREIVRPPGVRVQPRPGPAVPLDLHKGTADEDTTPPRQPRTARRTRGEDDSSGGSIPGIAGARRRRA